MKITKKALILAGVYWNDTWQRQQQFALYLARNGYEIYFIEHIISSSISLKKMMSKIKGQKGNSNSQNPIPKQVNVINAGFINPQGGIFELYNLHRINRLLKTIPNKYDIIINYLPINTTKHISSNVKCKKYIYDCVRNFTGWTANNYPTNIKKEEIRLCDRSDMIFTDSFFLTDKMNKMVNKTKEVIQFLPVINKEWEKGVYKKDVFKINSVGYFGTLSELQNDLDVYKKLSNSGITIHFWGIIPNRLDFKHLYHGYESDLCKLASEITKKCDAVVIAYKGNMDGVIPTKLMQSLGTRLPVFISSFYDSRLLSDRLYIFSDGDDLLNQIQRFDSKIFKSILNRNENYLEENNEENQYKRFISTLST